MDQYVLGLLESFHKSSMSYTAARFFIFVAVAVFLYYLIPRKCRWILLLVASGYFYYEISGDITKIAVFGGSIVCSYIAGLGISRAKTNQIKKLFMVGGVVISALPLLLSKTSDLVTGSILHRANIGWIIPVGLSFYSMQIISYLVDIYRGKIEQEKNFFKYALYISFFPIIIQGPISRYEQLGNQLYEGHDFDNEQLMRGIQLVLWGLFLKYLIADKSSVVVNAVFDNYEFYSGFYILLAAALYSIQLYTDFLSCVTISQGVAGLFGIELIDNFQRPYFSRSIKEFWRRWHISLSEWLRDYVYISLGGNRKGKLQKYLNLIITFAVSGLWHGGRWKYVFWGLMHAGYQIAGDITRTTRERLLEKIALPKKSKMCKLLEMAVTSFLVMIAWIIFRADSLIKGLKMIVSMFSKFNPWIFFDNSIFRLGLSQKEFEILAIAIAILVAVSWLQEKGIVIRDWFNRQNTIIRWCIYLGVICVIWVFGTYGYGFNAADFIYGGF